MGFFWLHNLVVAHSVKKAKGNSWYDPVILALPSAVIVFVTYNK